MLLQEWMLIRYIHPSVTNRNTLMKKNHFLEKKLHSEVNFKKIKQLLEAKKIVNSTVPVHLERLHAVPNFLLLP